MLAGRRKAKRRFPKYKTEINKILKRFLFESLYCPFYTLGQKRKSGSERRYSIPYEVAVKQTLADGNGIIYSSKYLVRKMKKHTNVGIFKNFVTNELKQLNLADSHKNNISFLGIVADLGTSNFMIVPQFGNLRDHLQSKTREGVFKISWPDLIQIAEQITFGLHCIHKQSIVHGDLHPENILIHDGNAFIADFGSSKIGDNFDPQCFTQLEVVKPNFKSDIYSLGLILWELTSGIRPFMNIPNKFAIGVHIAKGFRDETVSGTPKDYATLYKECWNTDPKKRPEINEILSRIQQSRVAIRNITIQLNNKIM